MKKLILNKNGQSLIESTVALVLILLFLGGIIKIWMWGNRQIVERQVRFNESRILAGTASDDYKFVWGKQVYNPPELKEDEVITSAPLLNGGR